MNSSGKSRSPREWVSIVALALCLVSAWLAYAPGLDGDFIFDDFPNLTGLSSVQDDTLSGFAKFVLNDVTGSLGRPLSLISFALQSHSWPDNPEDFIRVNILIHLLNGALLCWGLLLLPRQTPARRPDAAALAVCAMAVWLISPLHSGAVLYVVQRMALLAGTFVFAGFALYLAGRDSLSRGNTRTGLLLMTSGVACGLGLGVLAKENAALFPLLLLVAEFTLLGGSPRPPLWRRWAIVCIGLPLSAFGAYLLIRLPGDLQSHLSLGGVSSPERALSQPWILFLYLKKMLLPSLYSIRIMFDDLPASTSLWTPWMTLPALLGWAALAGFALAKRRTWPIASFAVLWFLANHLLESTFIPLELAFDHRNYIAVAGVALAVVVACQRLLDEPRLRRIRSAVAVAIGAWLLFLGAAQWNTANLWGHPYEMFLYWQHAQPDSRRVSYELADSHFRNRHPLEAMRTHQESLARWPGDATHALSALGKGCAAATLPVPSMTQVQNSLDQYDGHPHTTTNLLDRLIRLVESGLCDRYSPSFLVTLVDQTYAVPALHHRLHNQHLMRARIYWWAGDHARALDEMDAALKILPALDIYEAAAGWAVAAGAPERARDYLDAAERSPKSRIEWQSYRESFARLRESIGPRPADPAQ